MAKQMKNPQAQQSSVRPVLVESEQPNPEVKEPRKRRVLTANWKLDFLRKFDACKNELERGKLLRSESIYQSQVYQWKKEVREGKLFPGCCRKRGPGSHRNPQMEALEKENARLKKQLMQAQQIIELQKKVAALFGNTDENNS